MSKAMQRLCRPDVGAVRCLCCQCGASLAQYASQPLELHSMVQVTAADMICQLSQYFACSQQAIGACAKNTHVCLCSHPNAGG